MKHTSSQWNVVGKRSTSAVYREKDVILLAAGGSQTMVEYDVELFTKRFARLGELSKVNASQCLANHVEWEPLPFGTELQISAPRSRLPRYTALHASCRRYLITIYLSLNEAELRSSLFQDTNMMLTFPSLRQLTLCVSIWKTKRSVLRLISLRHSLAHINDVHLSLLFKCPSMAHQHSSASIRSLHRFENLRSLSLTFPLKRYIASYNDDFDNEPLERNIRQLVARLPDATREVYIFFVPASRRAATGFGMQRFRRAVFEYIQSTLLAAHGYGFRVSNLKRRNNLCLIRD